MTTSNKNLVAPNWGERFVNKDGFPNRRPQAWVDEITRILTEEIQDLSDLEDRVELLERERVTVTATESPYQAKDSDLILCDMSLGDIEISLPSANSSSVGVSIARNGSENELSVTGSIAKGSPMFIRRDNSRADMISDGVEWRP
jgi:hypothetical protein